MSYNLMFTFDLLSDIKRMAIFNELSLPKCCSMKKEVKWNEGTTSPLIGRKGIACQPS